ncbi:Nuclear factor interleukin-3-regulated protein [Eumeta japonica]|uniref:Nuclear factor interleukin-3-regulated protein n=1 Tax=Eumeta variegata TaxID=151549 RepID=A0A4C1ZC99_EUMVA|nr:Nuclear factor interleukin-3-regulated protein [Eumeta japonica]
MCYSSFAVTKYPRTGLKRTHGVAASRLLAHLAVRDPRVVVHGCVNFVRLHHPPRAGAHVGIIRALSRRSVTHRSQNNHSEDSCGPGVVRRNMVAEFILSQQQLLGAAGAAGGGALGPAPAQARAPPPPRGRLSVSPHYHDKGAPPGEHPDYPPNFEFKRKEFFGQRKQREFIPDSKKDDGYWDRRRRNNEAAKRSREKRRFNDMVLEQRVVELSKENHVLKAQLDAIKDKYGICGETLISIDQVLATLPTCDQVLCVTKRSKLTNSALFPPTPASAPTASPSPPLVRSEAYGPTEPCDYYPHPVPPPHALAQPPAHHPSHVPHAPPLAPLTPHPAHYEPAGSVLNLSRSRRAPSPYELSSLSGCSAGSSDEIGEQYVSENNGLPLKLRHKSHLGDKDAASALLALHHIKQEPSARASPPWDEGSGDERDSGISLGGGGCGERAPDEDDAHLKAELARLATEVATLKNLMHQNKRQHEH